MMWDRDSDDALSCERSPVTGVRHAAPGFSNRVVEPRPGAARFAIALAVLSPLAVLPSAFNPYNFPKLLVMALAIAVGVYAEPRGRLSRMVQVTVAVGALAFVVASLNTASPIVALIGRWPRYEGLPTLAVYLGAAWLGARVLGESRPQDARALRTWTALGSVILAVFSVLDAVDVSPLGWTSAARTGSLLGNATDQGLVAMMLFAVLLAEAIRERQPLVLAGVVGSVATIGLSGSRSALLGTLIVVALHVTLLGRARLRSLAVVLAALALAVVSLPQARDRLFTSTTWESRKLAWQETVRLLDGRILGVGPSGYSDAIGRFQDPEWVKVVGAAAKPDSPHSWPLQALSAGGYPLLLIALFLAWLVVKAGWYKVGVSKVDASSRRRGRLVVRSEHALGLYAAVVAYGSALLLNFTTPGTTCLAAFLTGALIAVPVGDREPVWQRWAVAVGAVTAVAGLISTCLSEVALQNGAELAASGKLRLAVDRYQLVERMRPFDADVHMLASEFLAEQASRGSTYAARQAAKEARHSLRETPDSYEANVALGVALITEHKLRGALRVLDEAVADYPFRSQAYTQRAIARAQLGDLAGGVLDLRRAMALRPDDPVPVRILLQIKSRIDAAKQADKGRARRR